MQENQHTPILEVRRLSKSYAGVRALDDVSLSFREGEVHALAGENGAGKSTLIKLITGAIQPTAGEIYLNGELCPKITPIWALQHGIAAIYQEFTLVPHLSVAENIYFGKEFTNGPFVDRKTMNIEVGKSLREMGIDLNPAKMVCDLGVAYQQIVEIVKAVSAKSRILIMDEPTAPLTNSETEVLFRLIARLKQARVTILFITHRMEEMFEVCDRVSVFRDGKYIVTKDIQGITRRELISYMVGRELGESYPPRQTPLGGAVLEVKNLTNRKVKDVSFTLKKGEILGFGGLVGAGRTEIMQAIFGADAIASGEIRLNGKKLRVKDPGGALEQGIGLIPEDRKRQGVLLGLTAKENVSSSALKQARVGPFVNKRRDAAIAGEYVKKLRIKTPSIQQLVKNLSGGNQQKVVLAKMLATRCDVIIFDEPTRGIDVGAKQEIYQLMRQLVDVEGKSVIMVSSEMPELIGMSDRILVMRLGRIVGELDRSQFSQELILEYASGLMGEESI